MLVSGCFAQCSPWEICPYCSVCQCCSVLLLSGIPLVDRPHLFICSPVDGQLDSFQFGALVKKASSTFVHECLCGHLFSFFLSKYLEVEWLK